jgi:hypothetical protein
MRENGIEIDESKNWAEQYKLRKLKAFLRKFLCYIVQGDINYILKGMVRRLRYGKQVW